ncbi:MAG TPA: hypothetical protein VHZ24_12350 [Pirellulales bacterium]|jgi:hypothetical protein|nr:hypothetical protein [Pirellulales bacterium]
MKSIRLALLVATALSPVWVAAEELQHHSCCPQCGCHKLKKVCHLVPEVKKVARTEYSTKCEDFCIPGRSEPCGTRCVNDGCGGCHEEKIWQPTCGCVRTRTLLVKKVTVEEKPGFKCVVEAYCCHCGCNCAAAGKGADGQASAEPAATENNAPAAAAVQAAGDSAGTQPPAQTVYWPLQIGNN